MQPRLHKLFPDTSQYGDWSLYCLAISQSLTRMSHVSYYADVCHVRLTDNVCCLLLSLLCPSNPFLSTGWCVSLFVITLTSSDVCCRSQFAFHCTCTVWQCNRHKQWHDMSLYNWGVFSVLFNLAVVSAWSPFSELSY
jgi:hypothetical protein